MFGLEIGPSVFQFGWTLQVSDVSEIDRIGINPDCGS